MTITANSPSGETEFQDSFSRELWQTTYKDHTDDTLDDTFMRIATSVASVEPTEELKEIWTKNFFEMQTNFKCTAGGRIYANAGTAWKGTTLANCFVSGAQVLTDRGPVAIQHVKIGDMVLTHTGNFKPVVNTLSRQYCGQVHTLSSPYLTDNITVTPEHPFYQQKEDGVYYWQTADKIDHILLARERSSSSSVEPIVDTTQYLFNTTEEETKINPSFIFDENVAYVMGRYIGDGSVSRTYHQSNTVKTYQTDIVFRLTDSNDTITACINTLEQIFGENGKFHVCEQIGPYTRIHCDVQAVATFMVEFIGGSFNSKQLPRVVWTAPRSVKLALIRGLLDADGTYTNNTFHITLNNRILIEQIQMLLNMVGISSNIQVCSSDKHNNTLQLYFGVDNSVSDWLHATLVYNDPDINIDNYSFDENTQHISIMPNMTVEQYDGLVYNISVADDESYVVNNAIVHNCFVSPRTTDDTDSLPSIILDINNQAQTLKAEGGWGQNFSWIRPRGAFIHGIGVETPGAVKYMEIYDKVSDVITSGSGKKATDKKAKGKIRKGAMMGVLDCWHPDIEEFIRAKQSPGRLSKFNISVNCTDQFMEKVVELTQLQHQREQIQQLGSVNVIEIELDDGTIKHMNPTDMVLTTNRGQVIASELTCDDDIDQSA